MAAAKGTTTTDTPSILYKYRPISNHAAESLSKRQLFFPTPEEINDPFDCRVVLSRDAPAEVLWEMVKQHYRTKYSVSDEVDIVYRMMLEYRPLGKSVTRERAAEILANKEWASLRNHLSAGKQALLRHRLRKTRLCCLSATPSNLLMWSHYADYHRGFCLGFSTMDSIIGRAQEVQYLAEYPQESSYAVDDEQYLELSLYSKAIDWCYEQEWRIVLPSAQPNQKYLYHYPADCLRQVIFGSECKWIDRFRIWKWLRDGGQSPDLFEAVAAEASFRLDLRPIEL